MKYIFLGLLLINFLTKEAHAKILYVSKKGSDKNNGTVKSPFLTISKAAKLAMPGDTILVGEGIYRERVAPARGGEKNKPIVYQAVPNKNVIIRGSDIWKPKWKKLSNNIYYAVPEESLFNDDHYIDDKNPFKVISAATPFGRNGKAEVYSGYPGDTALVYTCGQVFVAGEMYTQVPKMKELGTNVKSWFYDRFTGNLYIHFPVDYPESYEVEISTRRRIFAPHTRQLGYINLEGFILEHCGNQYPKNFWEAKHPEWQQAGALGTRSGHHWVIKHNIIRHANGVGIDFGNEGNSKVDLERGNNGEATGAKGHIIHANYITDNGAAGTAAYSPSNITFTNNIVERNNNLRYRGNKRWESAGVKMHSPRNSFITDNLIRNNYGERGLWLDQGSGNDTKVLRNLIIGNRYGFDLEIGSNTYTHKLIFANNILINNDIGISCREAGGITAIHNLIINSKEHHLKNEIDESRTGNWSSDHHQYFNNIFIGKAEIQFFKAQKQLTQRFINYNYYQFKDDDKVFKIGAKSLPITFTEWQKELLSLHNGQHGDEHSKLVSNVLSANFNDDSFVLDIQINTSLFPALTHKNSLLADDYYKNAIQENALPGPFQNLKVGANSFLLWKGMKPLSAHSLLY